MALIYLSSNIKYQSRLPDPRSENVTNLPARQSFGGYGSRVEL
jgi:hypothetical protein